ncbi:MAG TPA: hypothetical protein VNQ76_14215 [Planctomicrobium sp.]|nr:hypothetical protein [Planctomicrobium sp.]
MPGINDHSLAASEHYKALNYLTERIDEFPQWTTTVAFYVAVHAVEALFAHDGHHSDSHEDRNRRLKAENRYKHIWGHYRPLWNDSRIARYMEDHNGKAYPIFSVYLPGSEVRTTHLNHHLHQILQSVRKLTGRNDFCAIPVN